jgi:lysylphosphatidylglycerol synthetase-like protein (DUF2156 family)
MAFRGPRTHRDRTAAAPEYPANSTTGAYGDEIPPGLLRPRNGAGRAALVCGLIAFVCTIGFFLFVTVPVAIVLGLAAVVLGVMGRSRVRRGLATNRGSATFGLVTGLLSLLILAGLAIGGVALFNANKDEAKSYGDCVQQAGTNSQALQNCTEQFKNELTN